jgi:4-diphosphocytidyl-2-C-methyl-D-erythritol kinase
MPEIAMIIGALRDGGQCLMARMSGSGATCFGLYADAAAAQEATEKLRAAYPHWWVEAGSLNI